MEGSDFESVPGIPLAFVPNVSSPECFVKGTCHLGNSDAKLLVLLLEICQVHRVVEHS